MNKVHQVGEYSVLVKEARIGQIMDLINEYLKMNGMNLDNLDMSKIIDNTEVLFEINNIVKALPMVGALFNELVVITNKHDSNDTSPNAVLPYTVLTITEITEVVGHLKSANEHFFLLVGNLLNPKETEE